MNSIHSIPAEDFLTTILTPGLLLINCRFYLFSICSASQKIIEPKTFREAEPRGFGGWPPKKIDQLV
jgi:hypothetical protein